MLQLTATEGRGLIWRTPTARRLFSRRGALSITPRRVGRPYNAFRPCPDANGADHGRPVRTTSSTAGTGEGHYGWRCLPTPSSLKNAQEQRGAG